MSLNVGLLAEMVAEGAPDRKMLGTNKDGLGARRVVELARHAAARFLAGGAQNVVFLDLNSEALPVAMLGAAYAGLPFAPLNFRFPDDRIAAILRRLAPAVVVTGPGMTDRIGASEGLRCLMSSGLLSLGVRPPEAEETRDHSQHDLPRVHPDQVAVVLFTSGTTGEPKAAVLRHRHLTSYVIGAVEFLSADERDAQLVCVPPYHIAGVVGILTSLYSGRRVVYLPAFDAGAWVRLAHDEQITQAMVVPTMLGRILPVLQNQAVELPSLRSLSYGGGRMPVELIARALSLLPGVNFVNAYGLTETSSTISVLTPEDHRTSAASDDPAVRRRLGSVGRPLPSVEIEIRDAGGNMLLPGLKGEVHVRGEQIAGEYLNGSALTSDGWFPTRDCGHLDDDGYLFLDGRLDDVIVRGAENLSPGEIEETLLLHPAIAEAAVVGIPDPEWGEAVAAAVVVRPGFRVEATELQDWVRVRLRSTKVPQVIQFRDELPYNETGKLLRRAILLDNVGSQIEPGRPDVPSSDSQSPARSA